MIQAVIASVLIATISLIGAFFFGSKKGIQKNTKYLLITTIGVFLSILIFELIPETIEQQETLGPIFIGIAFILSYILSYELHEKLHKNKDVDCETKGTAILLLIGDSIHNISDGIILALAFLIGSEVGWTVTVALALHELPREILEFGILKRAGYTRKETAIRNFLSASSILVGVLLVYTLENLAQEYLWVITGLAAGNLLFILANNLLPNIHGSFEKRTNFYYSASLLAVGFGIMSLILTFLNNAVH